VANIVVTGGAGFIGSHLCEALLADGDRVTALDCFDEFYDPAIKRRNVAAAMASPGFTLIEGDIRDEAAVARAIPTDTDAVVHLAARAGVRPSIEQPLLYQDVNERGTLVLLERVRQIESCRFVFASSSSVYGNRKEVPFRETDRVDDPISPYAATKKAGELLCHAYHHLYGIPIFCLRFFTVYGPRQRPDLAIHKFARRMEAGEAIPVFGDGSMRRDFTYIDNIIAGVKKSIDRCAGYRIYNLGQSQPVTVSELIAHLEEAVGRKAIIERLPLQPGDVQQTYADVSRAQEELDYQPAWELRDGLARFVAWMRENATAPC
jgi:UDP-glucuronate 4-epimerase